MAWCAGYGTLSLCPRVPTRVCIPGPVFFFLGIGTQDSRAPGNKEMHGMTPILPDGTMGNARCRSLCIDLFLAVGGLSDDGYNGCCVRTNDCTVETGA